jgi:LacI family transcriptional regulator
MSASIRDVADRAGVSVGTVSNVLNHPEKVTAAATDRVHAAISALGFVRNDAARQLRAGRSRSIGLVVMDVRNPFFTELARGAEERAEGEGLSILLGNSGESQDRENAYLDLFEQQRVFGVLIAPVIEDLPRLERLRSHGVPTVLVDREPRGRAFPSVAVDDVMGGYLAVKHLADIGRRRLAFVGGPVNIRQVTDRLLGGQKAAAETAGMTLEVIGTTALTVDEGRQVGLRIAQRRSEERPDAVFAANDLLAIGLLQALVMTGGTRIPEDLALVGYDDIDFAAAAVIPLTSIRQPAALIGSTAVDVLMRQFGDDPVANEHFQFQPELIIRATTVSRR